MTYRYLYLCCHHREQLNDYKKIHCYNDIVEFEKNECYINFHIRQESLAEDVCHFVEKIRLLSQDEKDYVDGKKKTNQSKRSFPISKYYDRESIDLVSTRDRLLIDKFNYSPPSIMNNE
jgi:hypothetical protein